MSLPEYQIELDGQQHSRSLQLSRQLVARRGRQGNRLLKRIVDIGGAVVGLILAFPLFFVIAVLSKWEDPRGTILYKQSRVGKDGKTFMMYKFRSMITNADAHLEKLLHLNEAEGAMFKIKKDPRITRLGAFIRKTSMDELPQLWNVLRGEMSLVGPRPPLPREVEEYTAFDRQRLLVTPGCTGLWQVSGRNRIGFREMVELDLKYISEQSLWLDMKIIIRTVKVMIMPKDAY